jgi:hypothetical protein
MLRQKAAQEGKSINAVVTETLESGLGLTGPPPLQHDHTDETTLTLHKVPHGNATTTDISLDEFDRY